MPNVTFAFPPRANHVLKEDRPLEQGDASPLAGYNQDDAHLEPEALDTILTWLRGVFEPDVGSAH